MTEPAPETPPYAWLDVARVETWLNATTAEEPAIEDARRAAASWCERQRRDVFTVPAGAELAVPESIVQAGILATARLFDRKGNGATFGELAGAVLGGDPAIGQLLGVGRYAPPAVG